MSDKLLAEWFWIDRWVGSSAFGLNLEARGLYREMLTQAWRRGAWLPNDHDQIRRFVGVTSAEWKRTWKFVERFWRVDGDRLVNDTQVEVYTDACDRQRRASDRGIAGAKARHKHDASSAQAPAQAELEHKPLITVSVSDHRSSVPTEPQRRGQPPMRMGLQRLKFWRWMAEEFIQRLGDHAEAFDIEAWVCAQDRLETGVLTIKDWWAYWEPLFDAEVVRRRLPMVSAVPVRDHEAEERAEADAVLKIVQRSAR